MTKHTHWCIFFYDQKKRSQIPDMGNDDMIPVEAILESIHYQMIKELKIDAALSYHKLFLVNNISHEDDLNEEVDKGAGYRYAHFFRLTGNTEGYDQKMFCPK